ncbi:putative glycosyl hydrolase [Mytilinidion resinicola]|uniref:Glycosyl hydrolase n=1 Tax=Mytilinidion resinicola TaxID=574789 RepID=A0A6A6Z9F6_9PEZI|nr:putative glycosyl hydrolase [Mytilinidion resinicola]KAF2817646.1 putative glycosyl hydrolase [Mytilinidion resinicola]
MLLHFLTTVSASFFLLLVNNTQVSAQSAESKATTALNTLQDAWYNETSGIWDTCGWWNGANCMTMLADFAAIDKSAIPIVTHVFNNTYVVAPAVNPAPGIEKMNTNGEPHTSYPQTWPHHWPGYHGHPGQVNASAWLDGYYDDGGWWALAWIAAYDITKNQDYLQTAIGIFEGMTAGWPTNCSNGGIWWSYKHDYANAIANELFLSVAAHLANRVPNKAYYVNWAQKEWKWFQASGMINANNTVNDGLTLDCKNNGQTVWTYNQGVVLGGLVELNKAAPDSSYLPAAAKIAAAAISALTDTNGVLHDYGCEPNCAPDGTQFKGIFVRNLQALHIVAPQKAYVRVIQASANSIWRNDRDEGNMLSVDWAGPFLNPANASTHCSAMDALVAAVVVH